MEEEYESKEDCKKDCNTCEFCTEIVIENSSKNLTEGGGGR